MKRIRIKLTSLILSIVILITSSGITYAATTSPALDGTQSSWAEAELIEAYVSGLTYPDIMNEFKKPITREEFCTIVVKLYEKLTGTSATIATDPFKDTDNPEILKAYHLKIVNGTALDQFSPYNNITRQEICVMIYRALDAAIDALDKSQPAQFPFTDANQIASWAIDAMRFAYKNEIMKGTGNNEISPLDNTTREQAIVLLKRTFAKYSGTPSDATIPVQSGNLPLVNEQDKFNSIEYGQNLAFLDYDERIELYVSSGEDKPSSLPASSPINIQLVQNPSVYTRGSYSAFIDKDGYQKRWFAYQLNNAKGAQNVVWQVSKSPFAGFADNWKSPVGLVGSGQVSASKGEFQIDFGDLKISTASGLSFSLFPSTSLIASVKPITQKQSVYYVRAVPVDSSGNAIGEPGEGMTVIYGERFPAGDSRAAVPQGFELWSAVGYSNPVDHSPTNLPTHRTTVGSDPRSSLSNLFHFHGLESSYKQVILQVSTKPFPTAGGGWPATPNLIYEKMFDLPTATYADNGDDAYLDNSYPATVPVTFSSFAAPSKEMEAGEYINYYVRGVALKQSLEPGQYDAVYSDSVTVNYGYSDFKYYGDPSPYTNTQTLPVALPGIRIKDYVPAEWQDPGYMHHYYVFRAPKADEIKSKWKNVDTGEILYPYFTHFQYYASMGITSKAQYENEVIPRVLPLNAKVYFPDPEEDDKSWYEQLYDGIVSFFEDLWNAVKTIANQISASYANLKAGLINAVVDLCPVDGLKGPFKTALEGLVNYGLASVGIPPTLPNFDQLTDASMDYLADVALTEAGLPANEITNEVLKEVSKGIEEEIEKAAYHADPNPIDAAFLKLDPAYNYRPAYVDVEMYNNASAPSIVGSFNLYITFEINLYNQISGTNGLTLATESNHVAGSDPAVSSATVYRNHFLGGLNDNTVQYSQGDVAIYDVFEPKIGVKVPVLSQGERRTVRVYLEPFPKYSSFTRYPEGEGVRTLDFENMYFYNGGKKFTNFIISGQFPTARDYLLAQGSVTYLDPKTNYVYSPAYSNYAYEKIQKPVNTMWVKY